MLQPDVTREWAGRQLWCPSFRVDTAAGTSSAGDFSIAGFLRGPLRGRDVFFLREGGWRWGSEQKSWEGVKGR